MRSFASVILHLLAPNTQSVLLLDEPEAFLHPPQARLLGEFIAKERPKRACDCQKVLSSTSRPITTGISRRAFGKRPQWSRPLPEVFHVREVAPDRLLRTSVACADILEMLQGNA